MTQEAYKFKLSKKSEGQLRKLNDKSRKQILRKLGTLRHFPWKRTVQLSGSVARKLRVGKYRVIVRIDGNVVRVLHVGKRKNIYKSIP